MRDALENECGHAVEHPRIFDDGFKTADACRHFAGEVNKARMEYLEKHSESGYAIVCKNYWVHMHAEPVFVKPQAPKEIGLSWRIALIIPACAILMVYLTNRSIEKSTN